MPLGGYLHLLVLNERQVEALLDVVQAELLLQQLPGVVRLLSVEGVFIEASHRYYGVDEVNGEPVLALCGSVIYLLFVLGTVHLVLAIELSDLESIATGCLEEATALVGTSAVCLQLRGRENVS